MIQNMNNEFNLNLNVAKKIRVKKSFGLEFLTYLLENELQNYEEVEHFIGTFMGKNH